MRTCSLLIIFLAIFSTAASPSHLSIQHISDAAGNGFCTTFSVNEKERLYVTAAHCVDEKQIYPYTANLFGHKIIVKKIDLQTDLALIQAVLGSPQLKIASQPPHLKDKTFVYGFVRDHEFPTLYEGTFENYALYFNRELHQLMVVALFDMKIEEGQSGSPIVNKDGEVISVAQLWFYNEKRGGGPPWIVLYEFVKDILPK